MATSDSPNRVWLNNGVGVYSDSGQLLRGSLGHDVALGDLDGDGDLDALVANGTDVGAGNMIWLNDGSGLFTDGGPRLGSGFSMSVVLGDLDQDGDIDAVIANTAFGNQSAATSNEVWLNQTQ